MYRESRIEWLGSIPAEWDEKPLKALLFESKEKNDPIKTDFILSVTKDRGVIPYSEKGQLGNNKSDDIGRYKIVMPNDLVVNKMNIVIGSLGISKYHGALSQVYLIFRPHKDVNIRYYEYIFRNQQFYKYTRKYTTGIMELRESLNDLYFKNTYLPVPPLEEQNKIANFLDEKVAKIDNNIKLLEQELDNILLYKQEELSELFNLEDCFTTKLRNVLSMPITDGPHESPIFYDEGIPFISIDAIKNNKIDFKRKRGYISENDYLKYSQKYKPKKNDIYMIKSGSTTGQVAMVKSSEKFTIWSPLAVMRCNQAYVLPKYLFHYLQTAYFQKQVELNWSFGTQQNIGMRILEQLKVTVPTLVVQREIVAKIEKFNKSYDLLITNNKKKVALLEEYKKVLINDAVTGKIKIGDEYVK